MYRIRWDRVLAFGVLLSLPLGLDWLRAHLSVGILAQYRFLARHARIKK
ncbi:MAG: hypothetical protein IPH59_10335 [bacterium]|nr:hypothetical protein [bacterium]